MIASQLRQLAAIVRNNPTARDAIAAGFEIIADALDGPPCVDCAAQEHAAADTLPTPFPTPFPTPEQNEFSAGGTD